MREKKREGVLDCSALPEKYWLNDVKMEPVSSCVWNIMSKSAEERGKRGEKLCLSALLLRLKVSKSHVVAKGPIPVGGCWCYHLQLDHGLYE